MQLFKVFGLMTGLTLVLVGAGAYFGGSGGAILMFGIAAVIVNPLSGRRGLGLTKLLATHPPTEERVARLREMA